MTQYEAAVKGTITPEMSRVAEREGLGAEETVDGKRQLKGQVILALETPHSRMGRLANIELSGEKYRSVDEVLRTIDAVEANDIADLAAEFWVPDRQTMVWLGPELPSTGVQ